MKKQTLIDRLVCFLIVALCLAVFVLIAFSPSTFMDTAAVYRGF